MTNFKEGICKIEELIFDQKNVLTSYDYVNCLDVLKDLFRIAQVICDKSNKNNFECKCSVNCYCFDNIFKCKNLNIFLNEFKLTHYSLSLYFHNDNDFQKLYFDEISFNEIQLFPLMKGIVNEHNNNVIKIFMNLLTFIDNHIVKTYIEIDFINFLFGNFNLVKTNVSMTNFLKNKLYSCKQNFTPVPFLNKNLYEIWYENLEKIN